MPRISTTLKEARREAILQAAIDCLLEHGYTGTSMRAIAEAAGTTKGALYSYYPNKEGILLAVADRYMQRQLSGLEPEADLSAREQLRRLFAAYRRSDAEVGSMREQRAILDLWLFAGDMPVVREALEARYARYLTAVTRLIHRAQEEGTVRGDVEPEDIAGLILAARDGMVFQRVRLGAPVDVPRLTTVLSTFIVDEPATDPLAGGS